MNRIGLKKRPFLIEDDDNIFDRFKTNDVRARKLLLKRVEERLKQGYRFYGKLVKAQNKEKELIQPFNQLYKSQIKSDPILEKTIRLYNCSGSFLPRGMTFIHPTSGKEIHFSTRGLGGGYLELDVFGDETLEKSFGSSEVALWNQVAKLIRKWTKQGYEVKA